MGLSSFLSKLEITLKIWAKHAILMGYGCFTRSWNHHLRCVHLIVPSLVHLIVPTIRRKKILYLSNLVDQLTKIYKSIQPEVSFLTMGFNYNEKFGFFILLKCYVMIIWYVLFVIAVGINTLESIHVGVCLAYFMVSERPRMGPGLYLIPAVVYQVAVMDAFRKDV